MGSLFQDKVYTANQLLPVCSCILTVWPLLSWKRDVIACLLHGVYSYLSNDSLLKTEIDFIRSFLNGTYTQYNLF